MLQNAYLLAKIGADTAENEQHFAEILPKIGNYPTGARPARALRAAPRAAERERPRRAGGAPAPCWPAPGSAQRRPVLVLVPGLQIRIRVEFKLHQTTNFFEFSNFHRTLNFRTYSVPNSQNAAIFTKMLHQFWGKIPKKIVKI